MKRILVVAGSDSSGGAGLEADQKVIAAHRCYSMTATTALTAQNTQGVWDILETPPSFVEKQIDACVEDIGADVLKTGMLASASTIQVVAKAIRRHKIAVTVVDPVMVATSGSRLLPENAIRILCDDLLPLTTILTPNIPEAKLILQEMNQVVPEIRNLDDLKALAISIHKLGPKFVFLKGGHCPLSSDRNVATSGKSKSLVANVLAGDNCLEVIEFTFQESLNTHGTGCSLASAIASNLALGVEISGAVKAASRYVDAGIRTSVKLGRGSGPINHFHSLQVLPFASGGFIDYLLDRSDVQPAWRDFTFHEFVNRLGDGSLPAGNFKYYMIQDYLYLIHFARANALAGYKAKSMDEIAGAAAIVLHIQRETALHITECEKFGITQEMMANSEESQACTAYTRYVLDIGQSEDWLALQISLLPCLLGYGVIAQRLHLSQTTNPPPQDNRYISWINAYVAEDYTAAVAKGCALVETHAANQSPSRIEELVKIFVHATKMETGFWDMGSAGGDK